MAINVLTEESLETTLKMWQQFLRLQDWKITAEIVDTPKLDDHQIGRCGYLIEERCAKIEIVSPELGDRILLDEASFLVVYDMEKTLLHEILHVFLAPLEADSDRVFLEQRINHLADRLISGKWWAESVVKFEHADFSAECLNEDTEAETVADLVEAIA